MQLGEKPPRSVTICEEGGEFRKGPGGNRPLSTSRSPRRILGLAPAYDAGRRTEEHGRAAGRDISLSR